MNVAYLALTAAILGACVFGLWRLLRSESPLCVWIIVALSAVALLLRLVEYSNYPGGLNEDEPSVLYGAIRGLENQDLFGEGSTGLPQLIPILFQAQLVPLVGGGRWAIRLYSLVFSVLAVGATFGVARAMRMRPISSLAAAAFVVVLPWSLFYGRISQGGELLFNQLLLLAALSRLIWRDGTWREIPLGALALCLLFYDYFSGRAMLAMPFVAFVLASGLRKRLYCVIIPVVAFFGFLPQLLRGHQYALVGLSMIEVHPSFTTNPLATLAEKFLQHLYALYLPVAGNGWMTVTCGAMHPAIILVLAVIGLLTGFRRALFLLAGFMVGMMPGVLSHGDLYASTHRILSAYIFICLAAGASFDLIPWRSVRAVAASAVVVFVTYWSLTFYFSSNFWRAEATWMFSNPSTDITESIPWNEPSVIEADVGSFMAMRVDLQPKQFGAENLFLPGPALYIFGSRLYPLRPFYESLLLPGIVKDFGGAFAIRSSGWDSEWLHGHGWGYEITCESNGEKRAGQIPTLFHYHYTFSDFVCPGMARHVWRGKWRGPATDLRLWFDGSVTIVTSPGGTFTESGKPSIDFKVEPGAEITIRVNGGATTLAALYVVLPRQERLPYWEWVDPVGLPEKPKASS